MFKTEIVGKLDYFGTSKYYKEQYILKIDGTDVMYSMDSHKLRVKPNKGDTVRIRTRGKFVDSLEVLQVHVPDIWEEEPSTVSDDDPF